MRVNGVVERLEGGYAWVSVSVAQGCGRCNEPGGCGGVNVVRLFGSAHRAVRVRNDVDARPGERVGVRVDDGVPLRAALVAYVWPVVGVVVGAALGTVAASSGSADFLAGLGAIAGGFAAAVLGRRHSTWSSRELPLRLERGAEVASGDCGQ